jgi:hypothetical protein
VEWGPTGNSLVFVYQNDIYYKSEAKGSSVFRITQNGKEKEFFNGTPDWLYEGKLNFSSPSFGKIRKLCLQSITLPCKLTWNIKLNTGT